MLKKLLFLFFISSFVLVAYPPGGGFGYGKHHKHGKHRNPERMLKFFKKVQKKKNKRLKESISHLKKEDQEKIMKIIIKYDEKIFQARKSPHLSLMKESKKSKNLKKGKSSEERLARMEMHLKIRKQIIELELNKLEELKKTGLSFEVIDHVFRFEKKFMKNLRGKLRHQRHQRFKTEQPN